MSFSKIFFTLLSFIVVAGAAAGFNAWMVMLLFGVLFNAGVIGQPIGFWTALAVWFLVFIVFAPVNIQRTQRTK